MLAHLWTRQPEHLDDDAELEGTESVVRQCRDAAAIDPGHGRILANIVISATRPRHAPAAILSGMSRVTELQAADPIGARTHFEALLAFETDCWDVHASLGGDAQDFVLLDVRAPQSFEAGHVAGAINLPHGKINERNLAA